MKAEKVLERLHEIRDRLDKVTPITGCNVRYLMDVNALLNSLNFDLWREICHMGNNEENRAYFATTGYNHNNWPEMRYPANQTKTSNQ